MRIILKIAAGNVTVMSPLCHGPPCEGTGPKPRPPVKRPLQGVLRVVVAAPFGGGLARDALSLRDGRRPSRAPEGRPEGGVHKTNGHHAGALREECKAPVHPALCRRHVRAGAMRGTSCAEQASGAGQNRAGARKVLFGGHGQGSGSAGGQSPRH